MSLQLADDISTMTSETSSSPGEHPTVAADALFIKNADGQYTFVTHQAAELLGRAADELLGQTDIDLLGPVAGFDSWDLDRRVLASGEAHVAQISMPDGDADRVLEVRRYPRLGDDGRPDGIVGILLVRPPAIAAADGASDTELGESSERPEPQAPDDARQTPPATPEKKPAEPSMAEQKAIRLSRDLLAVQSAVGAIASSLNQEHVLNTFTWEMTQLLDAPQCAIYKWDTASDLVTCQAVYPNPPHLATPDFHLSQLPMLRAAVMDRSACQLQQATLITVPEKAWMHQRGVSTLVLMPLVSLDRIVGLVEVTFNADETVVPEQSVALAQMLANQTAGAISNAALYQERVETNAYLELQNAELDAFSHTVAHDLNGPLGTIIGFANLLSDTYAADLPAEAQEFLAMIERTGNKMRDIIEGLLAMASVRKEDVEREPLFMDFVVSQVQERLAYMIEEFGAEIDLPSEWPTAWGYMPWVEELWANYISNGIKYGGPQPRLELGGAPQADGMIRFWVRDFGEGLTAEQQARLFTPFTRLNRGNIKGHGLGLSIVQRIVDKLGGTAGVESEPGKGSTFYFTLPAQA